MLILSGVLVVMYVLRMIFQYIVNYWGHVVGVRMEYQMRKELFSHLQLMDFKFFDDNKVGSLMSRIVNDLREVTELAHHTGRSVLATLMLVGSFIYLYRINALLTIIVFVFVPLLPGLQLRSDQNAPGFCQRANRGSGGECQFRKQPGWSPGG